MAQGKVLYPNNCCGAHVGHTLELKISVKKQHKLESKCANAVRHTGGVRFSETELELLALAEYVKDLEAALDKQRALSSSLQQGASAKAVSGRSTTFTAFSL